MWVVWCTALMCRAKRIPFMCGWVQVESRCGHVSISWFGQSVQLGLGFVSSHNMFLQWFPMCWAYPNFKVV